MGCPFPPPTQDTDSAHTRKNHATQERGFGLTAKPQAQGRVSCSVWSYVCCVFRLLPAAISCRVPVPLSQQNWADLLGDGDPAPSLLAWGAD